MRSLRKIGTMNEKKYLVSEDQYSGQVVIVCRVEEWEVDTYEPTQDELDAEKYLGRKIPENIETKEMYSVKTFFHYEQGENRNTELSSERTFDKNEANRLFKMAIALTR